MIFVFSHTSQHIEKLSGPHGELPTFVASRSTLDGPHGFIRDAAISSIFLFLAGEVSLQATSYITALNLTVVVCDNRISVAAVNAVAHMWVVKASIECCALS
jgi:hypothetical protein